MIATPRFFLVSASSCCFFFFLMMCQQTPLVSSFAVQSVQQSRHTSTRSNISTNRYRLHGNIHMSANSATPDAETTSTSTADRPTQEWDVDRYQNQHSFVWQYGSSLVELVQPVTAAGEQQRILDIGCGTGELTHALALANTITTDNNNNDNDSTSTDKNGTTRPIHVIGMDADPSMVAKAQQQFPNLEFFQGDARSFTVDQPVDVVFSNAALHWIPAVDAKRAVACMANALKPGGRFVVEFGGKGNVQQVVQATLEAMDLPDTASPWFFPSISEYTSILEQHGIEVTTALLFDRPTVLNDGEEGLSNWLRMFGDTFFEALNNAETEQVLAQVNAKLRPTMFDGTQWTADYRRIRIIGRKVDATM